MNYPSPTSPPPKPPEWVRKVKSSLKKELPPDAYQRAIKIINHPKTDEARQILNKAWDGDYTAIGEIIKVCAICNEPQMDLPSIFYDKKEQEKQAKAARKLLKTTERLSRLGAGYTIRSGALASRIFKKLGVASPVPMDLCERSHQEAERETPNLSDEKIIEAIRITTECLELMTTAPRVTGRPEDLGVRNVLTFLNARLTEDFGKVNHRVAACILKATFPGKKGMTPDNIRSLLRYIRNK